MFRMEFHSLDAVKEDEDRESPHQNEVTRSATVFEQYRQRSSVSPPKIFEGRVGKFGRMQRVVSSNEAMHTVSQAPSLSVTRTRSLNSETSRSLNLETSRSLNLETSIPRNWVEVDLIDFSDPPTAPQPQAQSTTSTAEQEVIRELVKPFADSVNLTNNGGVSTERQPPIRDLLSNGVEEGDAVVDAVSSGDGNISGSLRVRTDSMPRTNSTSSAYSAQSRSEGSDAESTTTEEKVCVKDEEKVCVKDEEKVCVKDAEKVCVKDAEKGSPASNSLNKAFNKFMHPKKGKPVVGESKVMKPWDEPLLHADEQVKMEMKAQKEAKMEAKRMAEALKREAEIQRKELLELADPVPESSLRHHGMLKGMHKLFQSHGGNHSNSPSPTGVHGDVRESKLVMPRISLFEGSIGFSPPTTDAALAQIRSGPRPATKTDLKFATVESHQRDVRPWTMEEYMARNARLGEWKKRKDDEEFGGIEGNQLMNNQFFNNDDFMLDDFDDSDSD